MARKPQSPPVQLVVVDSCGTCRWWSQFPAVKGLGACYRFPPQVMSGAPQGVRPHPPAETMACGEFDQAAEEAARPVGFAPPAAEQGEKAA